MYYSMSKGKIDCDTVQTSAGTKPDLHFKCNEEVEENECHDIFERCMFLL